MMRAFLSLLILIFSCATARAGSNRDDLRVELIPDSLLKRAASVIRDLSVTIDILSPSEMTYTYHKVVTVLNAVGEHELTISAYYDKFSKIRDFEASVYDRSGKLLNRRKGDDIKDYGMYDGFSLYQDTREKAVQLGGGQYPVTVDFSYTIHYRGLMDYPDLYVQHSNQSIVQGSLTVIEPLNMELRYKCYNGFYTPTVITEKKRQYKWIFGAHEVVRLPTHSYSGTNYLPRIALSPLQFEMDGYKGGYGSWKTFGASIANMWATKDTLPESVKSEIRTMVKDAVTDRQKAVILYSYLQKNFRYVSIQIGTGGYIPFDATTVHNTRYGDCKALSNYMCAILGVVGVKAYPVLINAGESELPIDTTFTTSCFNHVILYAELDQHPLWLECTSSAQPFGQLGTFTENRLGLMISKAGGKILHTPLSDAAVNTIDIHCSVDLSDHSKANINSIVYLGGEYRSSAKKYLLNGTIKEKAAFYFNSLSVKQPEQYEFADVKDSADFITAPMVGSSEHFYEFNTGNKFFLPSSIINVWHENLSIDSAGTEDLILDFPSTTQEHLEYVYSASEKINLPQDFDLDNSLVMFHRKSTTVDSGKAQVETKLIQKRKIISHDEVALLRESYQKINKYLQQKLILGQ